MSNPPIPPFLQSFGRDLLALVAGFLLPRIRRRAWWHACGQLVGAAALALAAAALLVGGTALLANRLLGAARRELAFPYLGPLLAWAGRGHHLPLVAVVALLGALALGVLGRGLTGGLRRRWWALAALLTLLVVATAVDVAFTEGNGAVIEALNRRSAAGFWGTAAGLTAIYLLTLPIQFLNSYGQQRWSLAWRRSTTDELQQAYLTGQSCYRLQADPALQERIDNPDKRIAEDVSLAVNGATNLFFGWAAIDRLEGLDLVLTAGQRLLITGPSGSGKTTLLRVLSGGEQQRLGFARLMLRRPALVILDEASSALDLQAEEALYGLLVAAGPTVVSVGHRPSLRAFHHWELALEGEGGWRLAPMMAPA